MTSDNKAEDTRKKQEEKTCRFRNGRRWARTSSEGGRLSGEGGEKRFHKRKESADHEWCQAFSPRVGKNSILERKKRVLLAKGQKQQPAVPLELEVSSRPLGRGEKKYFRPPKRVCFEKSGRGR